MPKSQLLPCAANPPQRAITAYSATVGTPRAAIAGRTAVTQAIAAEIDRTDANLKSLLVRLILQFEAGHPALTAAYNSARKIFPAGGGRRPDTPLAPPAP